MKGLPVAHSVLFARFKTRSPDPSRALPIASMPQEVKPLFSKSSFCRVLLAMSPGASISAASSPNAESPMLRLVKVALTFSISAKCFVVSALSARPLALNSVRTELPASAPQS